MALNEHIPRKRGTTASVFLKKQNQALGICFSETTYTSPPLPCCLSSAILLVKDMVRACFDSFCCAVGWMKWQAPDGRTFPTSSLKESDLGLHCPWSIVVSAEQMSPLQWNHQCTQMEARITYLVSRDKPSSRLSKSCYCHVVGFRGQGRRSKFPLALTRLWAGTTKGFSG